MKRTGKEKEIMIKVLRYVRSHLVLVACSILFAAIVVGLSLYLPILQGRAIDRIIGKGQVDFAGLLKILLLMAGTTLLTALLQWLQNIINNRITFRIVKNLRDDAFRKIESLPLSYLDSHPSGDIVSRVIADADQFSDGLLMGFTQLFSGILMILGTLVFMFSISWQVAVLVVVLTPISLFVAKFIAEHTYQHFQKQSEIRGRQTALIDEMIGGQKVVQAYDRQAAVQAEFDEINEELKQISLKAVFFSSLTNPVTRFVNSLVYAASGTLGAFLVIRGQISVGQLSAVLSYANQYSKPFNEISSVITELQNAIACAGRLLDLIELDSEKPDASEPAVIPSFNGQVDIDHIDFAYVPERPLIQNFDLHVKPGQKVAIVGPTGCGKTTLINLLMRFYDVDQGDILVEGKSIYSLTRHHLRSGFGMVLQDTWIKEDTAKNNISMGRPEATEEEIIAAAKAAHADEFIRKLPQGYDTVLHDGSDLSQGQRQLLCIARVMLALPPMLILDEATSSIDTRTELLIQQSFNALTKGRTSFIVAHRLSTIRTADVILVMRDGNVVETGTHQELLEKGGFYSELYNSQFAES